MSAMAPEMTTFQSFGIVLVNVAPTGMATALIREFSAPVEGP
jgi:hypothetical protein